MSRYINMVDVITYPVMPVEYRKYQTMNLDDAYEQGWYDLQNFIEKMPTADVVEVVRCKDCVYYHPSYCEIWSKYGTVQTREKGFCYMAERKGEKEESLKWAEIGKAIAEGLNEGLNAEIHPSDRISGE